MIKAEWFKLAKSSGFRLLLSCSAGTGLLMTAIVLAGTKKPFGYEALDNYLATVLIHSIFIFVFAAVFISNEFANHTFGISLLCGASRFKVFLAKFMVFFAGTFLLILIPVAVFTIPISIANGFSMESWSENGFYILSKLFYAVTGYAALGSVALLIAVAAKHKTATIAIGILGTYLIMVAEVNITNTSLYKYIYICQIETLYQPRGLQLGVDTFSAGMYLAVTVTTFILSAVTAALLFETSELK